MSNIDYANLSEQVCEALRQSFTQLKGENPDHTFYSFAIFTDDSLQFANPVANSTEALNKTVQHYQKKHDSKSGRKSTTKNMRWSYGDWGFFPDVGEEFFEEINDILMDNFEAEEDVFEQQIEPLWEALLSGFRKLEQEGFFGKGEDRKCITLLVVGHVPDEITEQWVRELNPPEVAEAYLNWQSSGN